MLHVPSGQHLSSLYHNNYYYNMDPVESRSWQHSRHVPSGQKWPHVPLGQHLLLPKQTGPKPQHCSPGLEHIPESSQHIPCNLHSLWQHLSPSRQWVIPQHSPESHTPSGEHTWPGPQILELSQHGSPGLEHVSSLQHVSMLLTCILYSRLIKEKKVGTKRNNNTFNPKLGL